MGQVMGLCTPSSPADVRGGRGWGVYMFMVYPLVFFYFYFYFLVLLFCHCRFSYVNGVHSDL